MLASQSSTNTTEVKYVPEWFPGAGFKRLGAQWRRLISKTVNEPYEFAKARWVCSYFCCLFTVLIYFQIEGTAKPSLVSALLEESSEELTPLREHDIKWCASTMYIAGVDTVNGLILSFSCVNPPSDLFHYLRILLSDDATPRNCSQGASRDGSSPW